MNDDRPTRPIFPTRRESLTRRAQELNARHNITAKAVAAAVAVVTVAGVLLGLLAGAIGTDPGSSASAAPAAASASAAPAPDPAATTPPAETPEAPAESAPETEETPERNHQVVAGDTLADLAVRYGVPTELIAADNDVADPDRITAGTTLSIAVPPTNVEVITPGSTMTEWADRYGVSVADLCALNPQIADPDRIDAGDGIRVSAA